MLLFGVPHKGVVVDDIQKMMAGGGNHPRSALLEQIRNKSVVLAFQLPDFKKLIRDRKVDSESRSWRRTGDFFTAVDSDSALLQLPDSMEDKIPLDADHSMMVKFDDEKNRGYTWARVKLRQFEQDAPRVVAARFFTGEAMATWFADKPKNAKKRGFLVPHASSYTDVLQLPPPTLIEIHGNIGTGTHPLPVYPLRPPHHPVDRVRCASIHIVHVA
ncbi:hypothetical protein VE03_10332 [Pseudogymnoascus sp. 23342-1-I1]|nr:hypothetical protein VE03_10332 [Pseudogymnoascus sp. 23342-1-I1]